MKDDVVFSAKTGKPVAGKSNEKGSNVIPFPRRMVAGPTPDNPKSYAEQVTISCTATFADIDQAARDEIAALAKPGQESGDI